jgi:chloramphenicol 3-O phosphotransferase
MRVVCRREAAAGDEDVDRVANEERPARDPDHLTVGEVVPGGVGAVVMVLDRGTAEAYLVVEPARWLEIGIDTVVFALPRAWPGPPRWSEVFRYVPAEAAAGVPFRIETGELGERLVSGMHHAVAALARRGPDVIVDHLLLERAWLDECRRLWAGHPVLFVGVRCACDVLEARERERQDRTIGQAAAQHEVVHRWGGYDVEVDTSVLTPEAAAAVVSAALDQGLPAARRPAAGS